MTIFEQLHLMSPREIALMDVDVLLNNPINRFASSPKAQVKSIIRDLDIHLDNDIIIKLNYIYNLKPLDIN